MDEADVFVPKFELSLLKKKEKTKTKKQGHHVTLGACEAESAATLSRSCRIITSALFS